MTSPVSTSNHRTRPKPVIRRNQDPLSSELPYIREEKALNDSLITRLQQELDMRAARLRDTSAIVEMKGVECEHADLRLKAATSIRDKLIKTREMFTLSTNLPTSNDVEQIVSGLEDVSPNLIAVADSLNMGSDFIKDIDRRIEEANLAVRMALDAIGRSFEEEQAALIREEQCTSIMNAIQRHISEIAEISRTRDSHAIFRLHDEIWREIFLQVVNSVDHFVNPFPALAISAVSYSWRAKALAYPALWRNIHMRPLGFSPKDVDRVAHYYRQSGDKPLYLTLQFEGTPSDLSLDLLFRSVTGIRAIDSLLITGNPRGAVTRFDPAHIIWSMLQAISQPKKLEISYSSKSSSQGQQLPEPVIEGLEELVLRNSILTVFREPPRDGYQSRLVKLTLAYVSSAPLTWSRFRDWLVNSRATLEALWLEIAFSHDQVNNQQANFLRLGSIRTTIEILFLLFNSSIHTPALRTLVISNPGRVDIDAWRRYATDPRGGRGITGIHFIGEIGANDVVSYSSCLKVLPYLADLTLHGNTVEPLLEALTPQEAGNEPTRPLAKLRKLTIVSYQGDGDNILLFSLQYQQEFNPEGPSSGSMTSTLRVDLRNCPNIFFYVSRQLREIGSID